MDVRKKGDWESWIKFFLQGISIVSDEATETAKAIIELKERCSKALYEQDSGNSNYQRLLEYLFENPIIGRKDIISALNTTSPTAGHIIDAFSSLNILKDISPEKQRNKVYAFHEYIDILEKGTELYTIE